MKNTVILLLIILTFGNLNAQNRKIIKKSERNIFLQSIKPPIVRQNNNLRSLDTNIVLDEDFNNTALPSGWIIVDNTGNGDWTFVNNYNGRTLDGTPFAMIDSDHYGDVDIDADLFSPSVDVSALNHVYLSFDHYFNSYSGTETGDVEVYNGSNWVNVYSINSDTGQWGNPHHQVIDITSHKNSNLQIRFHYYNARYDWYWAIDNVKIFAPQANDLSVTDVLPEAYLPNMPFSLRAKIYNNGYNIQNAFDVILDIKDASNSSVFHQTIHVTDANLSIDETYHITTPFSSSPSLPVGDYTVEVTVTLADDQNSVNNSLSQPLHIINFHETYSNNIVYSYDAYDADSSNDGHKMVSFGINTGEASTLLGNAGATRYFVTGTFINGILIGVEFETNNLYLIDGNGNGYRYGAFTRDIFITGIAYDSTTHVGYLSTLDTLYKFDNDLHTTLVGPMNNTYKGMISIAIDNNANMYGIDVGDNKLYSIDTTTGAASPIGNIGLDINYFQDIGTDPVTGNLYGTLFQYNTTTHVSIGGLYAIDKITGTATPIGTPGVDEYTFCAIKGTTVSVSENYIAGLKVYPNPTNGMITVYSQENIQDIAVINLTGQVLKTFDNKGVTAQLDISDLTAGNYILKITTDKTVGSYQIIKK